MPPSPTKSRWYRGDPYWEKETPRQADAGRVRLKYYENYGKLQVVQLWTDAEGQIRPGRTVTLDVEALALSDEARALLRSVLEDAR